MGAVVEGEFQQILPAGEQDELAARGFLRQNFKCFSQPYSIICGKRFIQKAWTGFGFIGNQIQDAEAHGEIELILSAAAEMLRRSKLAAVDLPNPYLEIRIDLDLFVPASAQTKESLLDGRIQLRRQHFLLLPGQFLHGFQRNSERKAILFQFLEIPLGQSKVLLDFGSRPVILESLVDALHRAGILFAGAGKLGSDPLLLFFRLGDASEDRADMARGLSIIARELLRPIPPSAGDSAAPSIR